MVSRSNKMLGCAIVLCVCVLAADSTLIELILLKKAIHAIAPFVAGTATGTAGTLAGALALYHHHHSDHHHHHDDHHYPHFLDYVHKKHHHHPPPPPPKIRIIEEDIHLPLDHHSNYLGDHDEWKWDTKDWSKSYSWGDHSFGSRRAFAPFH